MKLKLEILLFVLTVTITSSLGQELENISWTNEDGIMIVRYDFLRGDPELEYEFYLYSSHDNFQKPLQETTGDVGKGIKVGTGKAIYWNAQKELGVFKGELNLRIKGQVYEPIIVFKNINNQLKLKRGNQYSIEWDTNIKADKILFSIERNGIPIADPDIIDNTGTFTWFIPMDTKPGKFFSVKISDTENMLRNETSEHFVVKRRIPLGLKIIPAVAIVGGVAVLLLMPPPEEGIPSPPEAPGN